MKQFQSPVHQIIYDTVVKPALASKKDMVHAYIVSYDKVRNRAVVRYRSHHQPNKMNTLSEVPVQIAGGLSAAGPFPGDDVWVHFVNGNIHTPRIVAIGDETHESKTYAKRLYHPSQGAYIPDGLCRR